MKQEKGRGKPERHTRESDGKWRRMKVRTWWEVTQPSLLDPYLETQETRSYF